MVIVVAHGEDVVVLGSFSIAIERVIFPPTKKRKYKWLNEYFIILNQKEKHSLKGYTCFWIDLPPQQGSLNFLVRGAHKKN